MFAHVSGVENPADYVTRCISSKILSRSNYVSGPNFSNIIDETKNSMMKFTAPNNSSNSEPIGSFSANTEISKDELIIDPEKYSNFQKLVST